MILMFKLLLMLVTLLLLMHRVWFLSKIFRSKKDDGQFILLDLGLRCQDSSLKIYGEIANSLTQQTDEIVFHQKLK